MVDNAEIELSGKNDIRNGDYIGYLQDNIDLDGLIGLWNFAGCVRDESGNDLHQEGAYTGIPTDTPISYPKQTSISKLYGKRSGYLAGTNSAKYLKIPDKRTLTSAGAESDYSIINFSSDFTISCWVRIQNITNGTATSSDINRIIFDKYNDLTTQGIMIYIKRIQSTTNYEFCVKVGNGTTSSTFTTSINSSDYNGIDKLIVVRRQSDVLKVFVNNVEIMSNTFSGDLTTRADIYLYKEFKETGTSGKNYTGALEQPASTFENGGFIGYYHQLRIYSRALSNNELTTLYGLNVPTITLKFFGGVWKIDDKTSSSRCFAKGLGAVALTSRLDSSILSGTTSDRTLNVYNSSKKVGDVVQDILKELTKKTFGSSNTDVLVATWTDSYKGTNKGFTFNSKYIAEGAFLDILNEVAVLSQITFTFMPTGVLQIEEVASLPQRGGLILTNTNSNLLAGGNDDSFLTNHLFACARLDEYANTNSVNRSHTANSWSLTTVFMTPLGSDVFPLSITKVTKNGVEIPPNSVTGTPTVDCYEVDPIAATIRFFSTTSSGAGTFTYVFNFTYNLNSANIPSGANSGSASIISTDATSINVNGLYARKISVPRITPNLTGVSQDISTFASNYVSLNKGGTYPKSIPRRVTVRTSSFIDHVIENNKIGVYYATKNIGSLDVNNFPVPEYLQIKKIEYRYPRAETIMEIGDFLYDSFDLERESNENIRQVMSNQIS